MTTVRVSNPLPLPRELMPKPSDAITAMIDGLRATRSHPNFRVNMITYGQVDDEGPDQLCCGCAATWAVFHVLTPTVTPPVDIFDRVRFYEHRSVYARDTWTAFEGVINDLRCGGHWLLDYYGFSSILDRELLPDEQLPVLGTDNWEERLPAYEKYRDKLKALGY